MTLASVHSSSTVPSPLSSPEAREDLNRYAEAGGFTLRAETHPWYAAFASVSRLDEARAASSILAELRGHNVPDLQQAAERLASVPGFAAPTTVRETATLVSLLARVRATLDVLRPDTYLTEAHTLDALLAATATPAWRAERGVSQSWWQRALLGRRARGLAAARGARREDLHGALAEAVATRAKWASLATAGTRPALPTDAGFLDTAVPAAEAALTGLDELTALLGRKISLTALPFEALTDLLDRLASDEGTLYRLPRLRELHDALTAQGLTDLLAQLTEEQADLKTTAAIVAQRTALDPTPTEAEAEPQADATTAPASEAVTELTPEADTESEPALDTLEEVLPDPAAESLLNSEPAPETESAQPEAAATAEAEPVAHSLPELDAPQATTEEAEAVAAPEAPAAEAEPVADSLPDLDASLATTEEAAEATAELVAVAEPEASAAAEAEPVAESPLDSELAPETESAQPEAAAAEAEPVADSLPDLDAPLAEEAAEALPEAAAAEATAEPVVEAQLDGELTPETESAQPEAPAAAEAQPVADVPLDSEPAPKAGAAQPDADGAGVGRVRPDVVGGKPVAAYSGEQLEAIVRWIDGDGVERSDEELLRAAMKELGFSRLGPRIKEALGAAVAAARG